MSAHATITIACPACGQDVEINARVRPMPLRDVDDTRRVVVFSKPRHAAHTCPLPPHDGGEQVSA